jgi:hypothetical protein
MANTEIFQSSSYSVLSFLIDDIRRTEIPIGIALWSNKEPKAYLRLARPSENIKGFKQEWKPFLELISSQISHWLESQRLPYAKESLRPNSDDWWRHLRSLLVHRVRLSDPKAIDCRDVNEEAELLYEAVVQPVRSETEKRDRVDRAITESLGTLSKRFRRGGVDGFHGRKVPVKRFAEDQRQLIILEGVNLAAQNAERDADALVSRLLRIQACADESPHARTLTTFVGYLASPSGLNGEAALVDWIQEKGGAKTFDLVREREKFAGSVEMAASDLNFQAG